MAKSSSALAFTLSGLSAGGCGDVEPHVEVAADEALDEALQRAGESGRGEECR